MHTPTAAGFALRAAPLFFSRHLSAAAARCPRMPSDPSPPPRGPRVVRDGSPEPRAGEGGMETKMEAGRVTPTGTAAGEPQMGQCTIRPPRPRSPPSRCKWWRSTRPARIWKDGRGYDLGQFATPAGGARSLRPCRGRMHLCMSDGTYSVSSCLPGPDRARCVPRSAPWQ
jgi:hypothetical protein